jgi:hypothetical protein
MGGEPIAAFLFLFSAAPSVQRADVKIFGKRAKERMWMKAKSNPLKSELTKHFQQVGFYYYSFTHMCIRCLGHFSLLPPPPPSPPFPNKWLLISFSPDFTCYLSVIVFVIICACFKRKNDQERIILKTDWGTWETEMGGQPRVSPPPAQKNVSKRLPPGTSWVWWCRPVIPAMWEVEVGRSQP